MPSILANGRTFFFEEIGSGDPVIFVSGLGGDHRAFAVPVRRIAKTRRALSIDNRDSGQSDRAAEPYSTEDLAGDLAAIIVALELPPVHLVGQSLGGLIAQHVALCHPNCVRSLTLVSTHAGSTAWKKAVVASWVELKRSGDAASFVRATLPWLVAPAFYEQGAAQIQGMIRFAERNEWPQDADAFARQAFAASTHEVRDRLGEIKVPTLVLNGEFDLVNPIVISRELADRIASSRFQVLTGVGHLPHVENVGTFLEALEGFLDTLG